MNLPIRVKVLNFFRQIFQIPALENWLAVRTRGQPPNALVSRLVPNAYQYKNSTLRTVSIGGVTLEVDISDYLGHYYFFGFRDAALERLLKLCHTRSRVLDIGANLGYTMLRLAKVAEEGKVIGFEPDPANYAACKRNLEINSPKNAQVKNYGLGSVNGFLRLQQRTAANSGGHRISPNGNDEGVEVEVKRLDDVIDTLGIGMPDLIKIDVEGYELRVLIGAKEVLRRCRAVLFIEVDEKNLQDQGDSFKNLYGFLHEMGYTKYTDAASGEPISAEFNAKDCHFDMIVQ